MNSVVEFLLDADDLAETVFAFSPLNETALSLRAWRFPGLHPEHMAGLRRLRPEYDALDTVLLEALVTDHRMIPDFLTPRPATALPDPAAEFAALRKTPPSLVRDHVIRAYAGGRLPPVLARALSDPAVLLGRAADALESYWQRCLAPWWPRMRALLEADVAYRGRTLALGGAQALFADLDERVSWQNGRLRVRLPGADGLDQVVAVGGRGLVLAPCLFARGAMTMIDAGGPPQLVYPARGRAALWEQRATVTAATLDELLGRTRSRLLTMLDQPISTTEAHGFARDGERAHGRGRSTPRTQMAWPGSHRHLAQAQRPPAQRPTRRSASARANLSGSPAAAGTLHRRAAPASHDRAPARHSRIRWPSPSLRRHREPHPPPSPHGAAPARSPPRNPHDPRPAAHA